MFPERLGADVESDAERHVFDALREQLGDEWTVFSQVKWLAKRRRNARDGEADFVIAHPRFGVLVLEVKGGGIAFDATSGKYTSTDRHGKTHRIKDPFAQARDAMHNLRSKIEESAQTGSFSYRTGYGVVFPDTYVDEDLGLDAPRQIVIDAGRLNDVKQALVDIYRHFNETTEPLSDQAIEALVSLLGRSWQIEAVLATSIQAREQKVRLLTEEQFQVLDLLSQHRRALIAGCAGSGKTMLAMEKARRLAVEGHRVLVTCYNQNLGNWLESQLSGHGVVAARFLSLCAQFAQKAGTPIQRRPGEDDETFYSRFPDALCDAVETVPDRFDAIIVDEGQDFEEEWWVALSTLLADEDDGVLYIFYDDNQRLYNRGGAFPIDTPPFPLTRNCRNTKRIHEAVQLFYQSGSRIICLNPEGDEPKLMHIDAANERREIEAYVDDLVERQKIPPGDIAILTRHSRERSRWRNPPRRAGWSATWDLTAAADKVALSTIHGFKGLERPVVIVCELARVDLLEQMELLYVAFSRARQYLVVVNLDAQALSPR